MLTLSGGGEDFAFFALEDPLPFAVPVTELLGAPLLVMAQKNQETYFLSLDFLPADLHHYDAEHSSSRSDTNWRKCERPLGNCSMGKKMAVMYLFFEF